MYWGLLRQSFLYLKFYVKLNFRGYFINNTNSIHKCEYYIIEIKIINQFTERCAV